ncbi:transcription factor JunD-like isoform X3 [Stegostoma tigrinum]|uniref:transcription factor JunD-like isoform X3 n=1 Tax=Stegostoma tigrinum TaxID=3053191 RepID=UPI00202B2F10|nr:transcription factor JunD-like isoform X3 [Stegostoma tigrinum]
METPFYHEDNLSSARAMKKTLSLPIAGSGLKSQREAEASLHSPDLSFLKLASPDLERLIIQSSGLVTTSPGPAPGLYSRPVTDEQNSFAEGFVKALEDLHKQNQLSGPQAPGSTDGPGPAPQPPGPAGPGLQHSEPPVYTNLSTYSGPGPEAPALGHSPEAAGTGSYSALGQQLCPQARLQAPKDEPQTVPDVSGLGDSPPLSPIDMDTQERIKAERKRLRNRIAASKCRKRKLERISRLEDKVKSLKCQNSELASTASLLREQVAQLKQKVRDVDPGLAVGRITKPDFSFCVNQRIYSQKCNLQGPVSSL